MAWQKHYDREHQQQVQKKKYTHSVYNDIKTEVEIYIIINV